MIHAESPLVFESRTGLLKTKQHTGKKQIDPLRAVCHHGSETLEHVVLKCPGPRAPLPEW